MKTSRLDEAQRGFNFTNSMINIDTVMDSIVAAQKAAGEEPTMEIAVVDRFTGKKYRRFQKRSAKEEESYQESKRMLSTMTRPEEPKISPDGEVKEEDENDGGFGFCAKTLNPAYMKDGGRAWYAVLKTPDDGGEPYWGREYLEVV